MSVPLYMDHHVKAAITESLRQRGVDVLTCVEDGTDQWEDDRMLARAAELGRALFTQDDDFLAIADQWLETGQDFAGVIYAHQLGITIGQAIRDLELIAKVLEPEDLHNRIEFLPYSQLLREIFCNIPQEASRVARHSRTSPGSAAGIDSPADSGRN